MKNIRCETFCFRQTKDAKSSEEIQPKEDHTSFGRIGRLLAREFNV
jgi:hypothetical protein